MSFDIGCPSFSHTYCMHEPIDEGVYETGLITFTDKEYIFKVNNGFIEYHARDESHVWRVRNQKDNFGNYFLEITNLPSMLFERGIVIT